MNLKEGRQERKNEELKTERTGKNWIVNLNINVSIVSFNVNGLQTPIKRETFSEKI